MNDRARLERYARAYAKQQAAEQARSKASDAGCSTDELIYREGGQTGRRGMDSRRSGHGWQIAEVERLLGLSRRDIQRACYDGQGGAGLVHPKDSSWGKRSYDVEDLATLFQVKLQRDQGKSLPEVSRIFEEARRREGGWARYVRDQLARACEQAERDCEQAAQALVLACACEAQGQDAAPALDRAIETIALQGVVDLRRAACAVSGADADAQTTGAGAQAAEAQAACGDAAADAQATGADAADALRAGEEQLDAILEWLACEGGRLAALWAALEALMRRRVAPDAPEARDVLAEALGGHAGGAREGAGAGGGRALPAEQFEALCEAPGMELALELRLGPGGYDYVLRAAAALGFCEE